MQFACKKLKITVKITVLNALGGEKFLLTTNSIVAKVDSPEIPLDNWNTQRKFIIRLDYSTRAVHFFEVIFSIVFMSLQRFEKVKTRNHKDIWVTVVFPYYLMTLTDLKHYFSDRFEVISLRIKWQMHDTMVEFELVLCSIRDNHNHRK